MPTVLLAGLPGTDLGPVVHELESRGHRVVDTDDDRLSRWVRRRDGTTERMWREEAVTRLLAGQHQGTAYVAATARNQVRFHPFFARVLLVLDPEAEGRDPVLAGRLRASADEVLDATTTAGALADRVVAAADPVPDPPSGV